MDKESWRRGGDSRPAPRGETSFDELAKGLASGTISRRQALRWMGGAIAGAAFASVPGVAFAATGGNLACDEFCHENFSGRETGQCVCEPGAHGMGPCYQCTPGIGPGPNFVPPPCLPGQEFNPETCQCEAATDCTGSAQFCHVPFPCGPDNACLCLNTTEGGHLCSSDVLCTELFCDSTSDCPEGYFCARSCCADFFGRNTCQPRCGTTPLQTQVESSGGASVVLPS